MALRLGLFQKKDLNSQKGSNNLLLLTEALKYRDLEIKYITVEVYVDEN